MKHELLLKGTAAVVVAGLWIPQGQALGQVEAASMPSLTGTWEVAVQTRGRGGTPEVLTLTQHDGGSLTGAFVVLSLRREESISDGRIEDNSFSFTRADRRYEGTIEADQIRGTMTYQSGNAVVSQSFTGTRTSAEVISFAPTEPPSAAQPPPPAGDPAAAVPAPTPAGDPAPPPASVAAVPDAQPVKGTLTIDGETVSFTLDNCIGGNHPAAGPFWNGFGSSEPGRVVFQASDRSSSTSTPNQNALVQVSSARYRAAYYQESDGNWTRSFVDPTTGATERVAAEGPLVTIDGSALTFRGIFYNDGERSEHELELKVVCKSQ